MGKFKEGLTKIQNVIGAFLDGSMFEHFFSKHFPFIMFLFFIAIMYVTNRYGFDDTVRQIDLKEERIRELKDISATISGDLMTASRPSRVSSLVDEKGLKLKFAIKPPTEIEK